jgi:prevent-host-death family protein
MIQVNTHEAKTKLSYLLTKVENEKERIRICRNGKPIAVLVPVNEVRDPLQQNPRLVNVKFHEDPSLPLEPDDWPEELR